MFIAVLFSRVNRRSRLFIGVFNFRGLTAGPACLLTFYFRGLTEGPACLLEFFNFRRLTAGPACLLSFYFRGLTEGPACLLEFLFSRVNRRSRFFIGVF